MPMSNYGRVIHQTQVEQITVTISEAVSKPGFDAADWQTPITNFGRVLQEIRTGVPDAEISAKHPGWRGDVLEICHKIVDGTLSDPNETPITDEQLKRQGKNRENRERKRMAAYRRRYGKSRDLRRLR